jgi:hypothetical protein
MNHYIVMAIIMIFAGILSTMNVWADTIDDMRLSINDAYMIALMTGWMIFFMGLYYKDTLPALIGAAITLLIVIAIRNQLFVTQDQYLRGMIPHHSMAVHMSRKLLEKDTNLRTFIQNIVTTQEKEIELMKNVIARMHAVPT